MADTDTPVIPQSAVDVVQPQVLQAALTKQQLADRVGAFKQLQTASGKPQMDADAKAMRDTENGYMDAINKAGAKEKTIYDETLKQMAEKTPVSVPEYHQIPPKDASTFFSMMMVLGALGGRSTMAPMTAAMNNMTGIMKAQNDHNDEMVAAQKEEFKRNFDHAMEVNKQMVEEKKQILENAKWNMAEVDAPLHDWALRFGVDEKVAKSSAESFQHQMTAGERLLARPEVKALTADVGALSPADVKLRVETAMATGDMGAAYRGLSWGNKAERAQISKAFGQAKITGEQLALKGAEYQGLKSQERTIGTRGGNIAVSGHEASEFAKLALAANDKVSRVDFVPLNKLVQLGENQWSPEQSAFVAANTSFINAYAAAVSRAGGKTVHDTDQAEKMLGTAQSHDMYAATMEQLNKELEGLKKAPAAARQDISNEAAAGGLKKISSNEEYAALPSGTEFIAPDGSHRRKPK